MPLWLAENTEAKAPPEYAFPLDQLTRVHAVMVHPMISVFDGNIRSRHLTEGRLSVLT
jgi:hypothetical protein